MDIQRSGQGKKRRNRRLIIGAVALGAIGLISLGLSRLEPAAPSVQRETVWIDKVVRGDMDRAVRGPGTLVALDVRFVPAPVDGRIERIPALPGVTVTSDTILMDLSNTEVQQNAAEAQSQLTAAEADYKDLQAKLSSEVLNQESSLSAVQSQAEQAKLQAQADAQLLKDGLIPKITAQLSRLKADQLVKQESIEKQKVVKSENSADAQLAAQRARVEQSRANYELRRGQLESLHVRAGIDGVLQELPVQVGQRVTQGTNLARVARPEHLKAELRIPETQAKDVKIGQRASIDTRNGLVAGHVIRVAPSVQDGTVVVDAALDGPLPEGARVDLSVDGTIEIERLDNVLHVGRPAYGQPQSTVEMFKLVDGGKSAVRVPVKLGRSSVNTIEVVSGLAPGEQVILSDTSAWDGHDVIRLN
jgi:HlyD family secretion protein